MATSRRTENIVSINENVNGLESQDVLNRELPRVVSPDDVMEWFEICLRDADLAFIVLKRETAI